MGKVQKPSNSESYTPSSGAFRSEKRNAYRVMVRKTEGKTSLGRPKSKRDVNIK
jgi:hypothetical protein